MVETAFTPLKYKRLKETHPEYDVAYWCELRALYEGGRKLLRNPEVFDRLFPRHAGETDTSYQERKKRAFYVNHLGTVIDFVVAGLAQDPARLLPPGAKPGIEVQLEEFYASFAEDCSPPGGAEQSFADLLRENGRTGLLLGRWWTLVDLPRPPRDPGAAPESEADQRAAGLLDGYAVELAPECVLDWERDETSGELLWAMVRTRSCRRLSPAVARDTVRDEYRYYTRAGWALYVVEYSKDQSAAGAKKPPGDDEEVAIADQGSHSFGRVPVLGGEMPPGLWLGNKLHSLAVEYLNKSCGLSWAETKDLLQVLYEFLAPELPGIDQPISEAQTDPKRADRKPRAPGIAQIRGKDDRAEYVGPETAGFVHSLESLRMLREDIYRVTYQAALGEDNKGALVRRSADSKKLDHAGTNVVLGSVGTKLRDHGAVVVNTVAVGRGDLQAEGEKYSVAGMERFDVVELADQIEQAIALEAVSVPSATYQRRRKLRLVRADLGDDATADVMKQVERELEQAITQDALTAPALPPGAAPDDDQGDDDQGDDPDDQAAPPPGKAARGKR